MTVAVQNTKVTAPGNDVATVFSFSPLVIFETTDLEVTHVAANGVETPLSEGTGDAAYAVVVAEFPGTGDVVYPEDEVAPLPTGQSLIIKRVLTLEQLTNLENQGGYFPEVQETSFDKGIMIDLQQQEELDRTIKIPVSSLLTIDTELPPVVADEFLKWNAAGDAIVTAATTAGIAIAASTTPIDGDEGAAAIGVSSDFARGDHKHAIANDAAMRTHLAVPGLSSANVFTADQTVQLSDDTSGIGPTLTLDRLSASPAVNDNLGRLNFSGRNDAAQTTSYALLAAVIKDATDASEDGQLTLQTRRGGSMTSKLLITDGIYTLGATGGSQGVDTINSKGYYVDGVLISGTASETVAGIAETATDAEMEAASATDKIVVPENLHRHPAVPKVWVEFNGTTGSLIASYNMTSVTDNGTGDFTPNWNTDFASGSYAVLLTVMESGTGVADARTARVFSQAVGSSNVRVMDTGNGQQDCESIFAAAYGDHA